MSSKTVVCRGPFLGQKLWFGLDICVHHALLKLRHTHYVGHHPNLYASFIDDK